jgi:hypothetical protein
VGSPLQIMPLTSLVPPTCSKPDFETELRRALFRHPE